MEIAENIKIAFGEDYANVRRVQRWFVKFKVGDFSVESYRRKRSENVCAFLGFNGLALISKRLGKWLDKYVGPEHVSKSSAHPKKMVVNVWWSKIKV